jgi:hypothetical protein
MEPSKGFLDALAASSEAAKADHSKSAALADRPHGSVNVVTINYRATSIAQKFFLS